jgi:hypothetical protein
MLTDGKPVIDYTRVADGFQFDTHRLRCQYLGKTTREKPRFLEEHRDQFQRVEDILRESAQSPDGVGAARTELTCHHTLSPDSRNEGDDHHNSLAGCSPPCQPESVPAPVNGNVPSGSTQTELPPSAEAATSEIDESETDTTPLEETGRKQGRVGRQRKKRRLSAKALKARRKDMLAVLEYLPECPVLSDAARKAGIHRKKLEYWIKRSKAGDDGYDFECEGLMWRFHKLVDFAIEEANDKVDVAAWKLAMGELYKKEDGREVPHLYVRRPNGKMIRFLLARKFPEKYGKHPKVDVPQQGGIVLIGAPKKPKKTCAPASVKARQWKALSRRVREAKD